MRVARADQAKTQRALASIVLGFELIVSLLIGLAVFGLGLTESRELGLWLAGALVCVCLSALGLIRVGRWGIWMGHLAQLAVCATAFILPAAVIVAGLFAALWVFCMVKGAQIDRDRTSQFSSARGG